MPDHLDLALDLDGDRAALEALANEARRRLGSSTHHMGVGAAHLRVEFIGSALRERLGPALAGLSAANGASPAGAGAIAASCSASGRLPCSKNPAEMMNKTAINRLVIKK